MARSASALVKQNRGLRTENQAKAKVMNLKHKERKMKYAQLDNPTTLINHKQATSVSTLDHSGSSSDDGLYTKKRKKNKVIGALSMNALVYRKLNIEGR